MGDGRCHLYRSVGEYDANGTALGGPCRDNVQQRSVGYYLIAVATVVDGAIALANPAAVPAARVLNSR
jgi:hypothetical protein